jgi:hypothetical protein
MQTTTAPAPTATATAAAQLAADQYAGVVDKMRRSVSLGKAIGYALMAVVLAATFPHVGAFLADHVGPLGWIFPAIFGGGLLAFYHVAQTPGLAREGRQAAYIVVALCGTAELVMQVVASPDLGTGALYVAAVVIGLAAKYAAARIRPDLTAIAAAETSAAAQVAALAPAPLTRGQKAAATRAANKAAAAKATKRATKAPANASAITNGALPEAPVSPAVIINGQTNTGLWVARNAAEALAKI